MLNLWLKLNFWNSGVLSGKAYLKTPFNLKPVVEALERLLFEAFAEVENEIEIRSEASLNLINYAHPVLVVNSWIRYLKTCQLLTLPTK